MSPGGPPPLATAGLLELLDEVSVLIYVQDPEGRIVHANRAARELVNLELHEILGRLPHEIFDEQTAERWTAQNGEVLRSGRALDVEDGWGGRTYLTQKTPLFGADGRPAAVLGVSTDITERTRAEEKLRRSEARLTDAQQIAGVGSWHWNAEHDELTWSPELYRLYGLTPGEAPIGRDALLLVHEEDRERVGAASRAAMAGEGPMELDMRILRADGEVRVLHCRGTGTLSPDGTPSRLDGTCVDVTDRRRAESRLAEAQRLAQLGSFDWDIDRGEISWSREMYRIAGQDPEHFVPTREALLEWIVEQDRGPIEEQIMEVVAGGGDFDAFGRIERADGAIREVRFRGSLVTVPGGARRHLVGMCQDLTDVRRAEQARVEAVERFRSVFERAPVGMALVGRDGRFSLVNEAMAEFLGRSTRELLDCTVGDVTHPDDLDESIDAVRRMAAGELREWNATKRYVRPTGEVRWGGLRALLLHDADGRGRHCLALLRDVTEQRLAERRRSTVHEVLSIMAGGAPLREALPALVETVVRELDWGRGSLWLLDESGRLQREAAWPRENAPTEPPALPGEPVADETGIAFPVVSGSETLGLFAFAGEGTAPLGDDLAGFAETLGAQVGEFVVRKRADELLLHQALHDPLTDLPNRVLFFDRLDHAIRRQQREHAPLAVLFLDFDGFKAVNDRFGHAGGDEVLRRAADRVAGSLRAEDTVARFGGDELVILSEHVGGPARGALIAERIIENLRAPIDLNGEQLVVSASIGISVAPVEGATRDELLRSADAAMYRAKALGAGRYVIAD